MKQNTFKPFTKKFHGLKESKKTEGFHTSDDIRVVIPYAQRKILNIEKVSLKDPYIYDYPVIVSLNMYDFKKFPDYDAIQMLKESGNWKIDDTTNILVNAIEENIDNDYVTIKNIGNLQSLFKRAINDAKHLELKYRGFFGFESKTLDSLFDLCSYSESELIKNMMEYIKLFNKPKEKLLELLYSKLEPKDVMYIIKQYRYINKISEDKIIKVFYMKPFWPKVFVKHNLKKTYKNKYDKEKVNKIEVYGFKTLVLTDVIKSIENVELVNVFFQKQIGPIQEEFHGTSLKNLLFAAPFLRKHLPIPPKPYGLNKLP